MFKKLKRLLHFHDWIVTTSTAYYWTERCSKCNKKRTFQDL